MLQEGNTGPGGAANATWIVDTRRSRTTKRTSIFFTVFSPFNKHCRSRAYWSQINFQLFLEQMNPHIKDLHSSGCAGPSPTLAPIHTGLGSDDEKNYTIVDDIYQYCEFYNYPRRARSLLNSPARWTNSPLPSFRLTFHRGSASTCKPKGSICWIRLSNK